MLLAVSAVAGRCACIIIIIVNVIFPRIPDLTNEHCDGTNYNPTSGRKKRSAFFLEFDVIVIAPAGGGTANALASVGAGEVTVGGITGEFFLHIFGMLMNVHTGFFFRGFFLVSRFCCLDINFYTNEDEVVCIS